MRKKALWVLGPSSLMAVLLAACAPNATQNTLDPAGPTAQAEKDLFVPVFWVAVVVFVIVEGGIVLHRDQVPAPQGPRPDAAADAREHAARDRVDDRSRRWCSRS